MTYGERFGRGLLALAICATVPLAVWNGGCGKSTTVQPDAAAPGDGAGGSAAMDGPGDAPVEGSDATSGICCSAATSPAARCSADGQQVMRCRMSGAPIGPCGVYGFIWEVQSCAIGCGISSACGGEACCLGAGADASREGGGGDGSGWDGTGGSMDGMSEAPTDGSDGAGAAMDGNNNETPADGNAGDTAAAGLCCSSTSPVASCSADGRQLLRCTVTANPAVQTCGLYGYIWMAQACANGCGTGGACDASACCL
jgi:hypothetical protein